MNRPKSLRILLCLFIVLTVIFLIGIIVDDSSNNMLGRIGLWCGFISQLLLAVTMFLEIRREKKEQDK
jgi:heme/copper-type cytochrome/quinol oxidase subunit 4